MHYSEFAEALRQASIGGDRLHHHQAQVFDGLARALEQGQGYVAIVLDPDGLKIAPVHIEDSSQMTIRAKSTLRKIAHEVQIHSGASKSS